MTEDETREERIQRKAAETYDDEITQQLVDNLNYNVLQEAKRRGKP